jgi:hypothetical protein
MFGCTYVGDGNASNNVQLVNGEAGTFSEGMSFDYLYGQGPDSYVDIIQASGGTMLFRSQDNLGRVIMYNGPSNNYRAIHSTVMFGAIRDGVLNKTDLMGEYLDYLNELIGVEELVDAYIQNIQLAPNPSRGPMSLCFTLTQPGRVSVKVYNAVGQLTRELVDAELTQGSHDIVWDGKDNVGRTLSSGSYIFRIDVDGSVVNKAVLIVK